ncbi:Intraflagellar transport protein 46 [Cladochytrium tenue]|nr:Intraflagellar transport protein 46 [Cladochytrium tenue]
MALSRPHRVKRLVVADMAPTLQDLGSLFGGYIERVVASMRRVEAAGVASTKEADQILAQDIKEVPIRQFLLTNLKPREGAQKLRFRINLDVLDAALRSQAISGFPLHDAATPYPGPALFVRGLKSHYVKDENIPDIRRLFPKAEVIKSLTNNHFDETLELSDDEDEVTDDPENSPRSGALARNSLGTGANDRIAKDMADQTRRGDSPPTKNLAESDEYDHSEDDDHLDDDDEDEEHDDEDDDDLSGIRDPAPGASLTTLGAGDRDRQFLLDDEDDPGLLTGDDEEDDEDEEDDDDDSLAGFADHGVGAGAGSPSFAAKDGQDVKDLFQYIQRYRPQDVELEPELKPFIPEYIPAIGDIDAFIKIGRPDQKPETLGLAVVDEPAGKQSDPTVLDLHLRAVTKAAGPLLPQVVRSLDAATVRASPKALDNWIRDVKDLHAAKPPPAVHYSRRMPDVEDLMQVWPPDFEDALDASTPVLPGPDIDLSLVEYARLVTALLDIPMAAGPPPPSETDKDNIKAKGRPSHHHHGKKPPASTAAVESLHVLFTLFSEFKNSQHFQTTGMGGGGGGIPVGAARAAAGPGGVQFAREDSFAESLGGTGGPERDSAAFAQ